jgi:cardiolipin synthase A/B
MPRLYRIGLATLLVGATIAVIVFVSRSVLLDDNQTFVEQSLDSQDVSGTNGVLVLPDDGNEPVLAELDAATESIWVEVYLLTDEDVIDALTRAVSRGLEVRVILEDEPFGGAGTQDMVFNRLDAAGVSVRWDQSGFRFSHAKFIILDQRVALVMNFNLTESAFSQNREFAVVSTVPSQVAHAVRIFRSDWEGRADPVPGELVTSPESSRSSLLGLIESARSTLDIYAEVITDPEMVEALLSAKGRGVKVRIIVSETFGQDLTVEVPGEIARQGVEIRIFNALYVHAKALIVDGRAAFIGSQNLTSTSLDLNREVGIVFTAPANVERVARVFDSDFSASEPIQLPRQTAFLVPASVYGN